MTALPKSQPSPKVGYQIQPINLELPVLSRHAIDELYHFLQYLEFKYQLDLEPALETIEDEVAPYDVDVALQERGEPIPWEEVKKELELS
ncbi:MAG: hypothetical protein AAFP20_12750 [Cyanobacteria bacterium J06614_10]